jgi:hypothetical protein
LAARKKLPHVQRTRDKIRTSMLINRLQEHVLAEEDLMSASQVNAAKILMGKTLPDMRTLEHVITNDMDEFDSRIAGIENV